MLQCVEGITLLVLTAGTHRHLLTTAPSLPNTKLQPETNVLLFLLLSIGGGSEHPADSVANQNPEQEQLAWMFCENYRKKKKALM